MVPKVFIILLMIVCAVAATGKPRKEEFEQITAEDMKKTMENLKAAVTKHENIKAQHASVKAQHDKIKKKSESAEVLLKKYNGEPDKKDIVYTDRDITDLKNAEKKINECKDKVTKTEKWLIPLREEWNILEKKYESLKQEKTAVEKDIADLTANINSFKEKTASLINTEIPELKEKVKTNNSNFVRCFDQKAWNPRLFGGSLAMWNANGYIKGSFNINENIFTIGLFITSPTNGPYQTIFKANVKSTNTFGSSLSKMANTNTTIEMGIQGPSFIMKNGSQALSIPFKNDMINNIIIITQTQNGASYYLNGKPAGGMNQNLFGLVGDITFFALQNGGIQDVAIITRVISDTERQLYEGYLAHKWLESEKIQDIFPANHPYRIEVPYK